MKILIACEESQTVCTELRNLGHEAYSADIQEPSGGHPEWHILGDVLPLINGNCSFITMDGTKHKITGKWDLLIAHPPCTYLTSAGTRHFSPKCNSPEKIKTREKLRDEAAKFFMTFANADCDKIAIENPVGYMNTHWRKADQIIHPFYFAESKNDSENYVQKRTCLWLKGLKPLNRISSLPIPEPIYICNGKKRKGKKIGWCEGISGTSGGQAGRAKARSKTFPGIAKAMAKQWCGNEDREVKHFQSWSGGKDSTASIILEHIYGLPPSKIIMSEVMFDRKRNISGELPEHMEWVHNTAIPLFRSWGYEVEIVRADRDYLDLFYHIISKSKKEGRNGKYAGFLIGGLCKANSELKTKPISDFYKGLNENFIQFVGIAADEPERLKRLIGTNKVSLLAKYGYTKQLDYNLCKKFGLLSPVYDFSNRGGCWFCPSATIKEYAYTKSEHPELWEELRKLSLTDNLVSYGFKYGETFDAIDRKVEAYLNARGL